MKLPKKGALIAGGILLLLGLALLLTAALLPRPLTHERQAERWAGESGLRFRQFTCILSPDQTLEPEAVFSFRESALKKIGESDFEDTSDESAFCDAWSTEGTLKVSGPRGSYDAAAVAVGGRYFDFHPLTLLSGVYLTESDLLLDRVVLDEQLAWMLFGGTDVAGMTIAIGEGEYYVAGVVARQDDRFTRAAGEQGATIYLQYASRALLSGGVTSYEIVLPEPVKGFARSVAEDPFAKQGVVVQNTDRFSFGGSLQRLAGLTRLGVRTTAAVYPVWENAATVAETACALLRAAALLCLAVPAVMLCIALLQLLRLAFKKLKGGAGTVKESLLDRRDARRERRIARRGGRA